MSLQRGALPADRPRAAGGVLAGVDPIMAAPDHDLIAAVITAIRTGQGSDETRLLWARWAYGSAEHLMGTGHPLWRQVAQRYRKVLAEQNQTFDAVRVSERLVDSYRAAGPPWTVLTARCALAMAWHHDGQCDLAYPGIQDVLAGWLADPGNATRSRSSERILLSAAEITAGCGDAALAEAMLRQHARLIAGLGREQRWQAARWLAGSENLHPENCQFGPRPDADIAARARFWRTVLDLAVRPAPVPPSWPAAAGPRHSAGRRSAAADPRPIGPPQPPASGRCSGAVPSKPDKAQP